MVLLEGMLVIWCCLGRDVSYMVLPTGRDVSYMVLLGKGC